MKQAASLIIVVAVLLFGAGLYCVCTETVGEGYFGLVGVKEVLDSIGD